MVELRPVRRAGDRVAADADPGSALGLPPAKGTARPRRRPEATLRRGRDLVLFLPGAVAGGALGWFIIRPVNWVLGSFFRGFNWVFDAATDAYGKIVGWCLRLSAIVLLVYVGLIGLTGFGFTRIPDRLHPHPGQGLPAGQHPAARLGLAGAHGRGDRRRSRRSPWRRPASPTRSAIAGQSFVLNANSSELRLDVHHPQAVPRPARTRR